MERRDLLRTVGTAAVGAAAISGMATAVTDPSNATSDIVYTDYVGDYNYASWDTGIVRVYGVQEYSESDIEDVCADVSTFVDKLVSSVSAFSGFRVKGFTTNLDPFTGDYGNQRKYVQADEYVDAFGHDSRGGGNVWLVARDDKADNGTLDRPHNCVFGPHPYDYDSSLNFQYPHSFARDNTADGVYWSTCHELAHQMARTEYYQDALPDTDSDHYLADTVCDNLYCTSQSATIMARPGSTNYIENGDCTGVESAANSHSLSTSSCTKTAIDETRLGVKNN